MPMDELTLVLAHGHQLMRAGLRLLLENRPGYRVIGEAATAPESIALVQDLQPAILIVDATLPEGNGLDMTRTVCKEWPHTRVMILATDLDESYVQEALQSGAAACVLSGSCPGDILYAITQVAAGRRYLSPPLAKREISNFAQPERFTSADPLATLSPRERHVLALVALGMTSAAIAHHLNIGVRTVERHRDQLLHKLGLHNSAELVHYALEHGLLAEVH
jgi:DNA-binding NarL/FixJ family response regulator